MKRRLLPVTGRIALYFVVAGLFLACSDGTSPATLETAKDATAGSVADLEAAYSETFTRMEGAPVTETRAISTAGFEAPFRLRIRNGAVDGSARAASATIAFNGVVVAGQRAFNQHTNEWTIAVASGAQASLDVRIASAPGSEVTITLEGKRSHILFCTDGRPGSIPDLSAAIARAPTGGTVLVCDGTHDVDDVPIGKAVTIRSQNPGGAWLRDADPTGARYALRVDAAPGTVRLADLGFIVRARGVLASGAFGRLEIDGSRFVGVEGAVGRAVSAEPSTNNSVVSVARSSFEQLAIGVTALAGQLDVRNSRFERARLAVQYSMTSATLFSYGTADANVIRNCVGDCVLVRSVGTGGLFISNNEIDNPDPNVGTGFGVAIRRAGTLPPRTPIVVEGNRISSVRRSFPLEASNGWTLQSSIIVQDAADVVNVIRGNTITGSLFAVRILGSVDVRDNVISGAVQAFSENGTGAAHSVTVTRNDAATLVRSFAAGNATANFRCNWWGSNAGPVSPPPVPAGVYTPWASAPIAGQPALACGP